MSQLIGAVYGGIGGGMGGGGMGPIIGVGVGALHLVGAAVGGIIPAWLGITYLTAPAVYKRSSTKPARELQELANRLPSLGRGLVDEKLRRHSTRAPCGLIRNPGGPKPKMRQRPSIALAAVIPTAAPPRTSDSQCL